MLGEPSFSSAIRGAAVPLRGGCCRRGSFLWGTACRDCLEGPASRRRWLLVGGCLGTALGPLLWLPGTDCGSVLLGPGGVAASRRLWRLPLRRLSLAAAMRGT